MIFLQLFLSFLKVGSFSFGGGYGMISLIREEVINHGWLTEEQLLNFIAVAESTPGPIAVNIATFVGSSQAGFFGALLATLGVILPAFVIILLIAMLLKGLLEYAGVKAVLSGFRPAVVGLVIATAVTMLLSGVFSVTTVGGGFSFDWRALVIVIALTAATIILKLVKKQSLPPLAIILISAALGCVLYSL